MSVVTDVILITAVDEDNEKGIVARLFLERVDHPAGGNKAMQCGVYMGAFNHLVIERFIQNVRALKWHDRECVQLMVKEEDDNQFRIIEI